MKTVNKALGGGEVRSEPVSKAAVLSRNPQLGAEPMRRNPAYKTKPTIFHCEAVLWFGEVVADGNGGRNYSHDQ
jgi:hypothetical protein